ncbi:MAG: hypothetical protein OEV81_13425 [Betaproteobacteria bacterium]|nr:hypothetical protein [Betaproteobacteria bacterium]MDH5222739.1 hypothetical protein [Betaproteobacteria bacterium]
MRALLERLGSGGLLALAILAGALAVHAGLQRPLEQDLRALRQQARGGHEPAAMLRVSTPAAQMNAFYGFFDQPVALHEWLAKLYGIGRASGVELPAADYRLQGTGTRLARYQLTLPVRATYSQARAFIANALNEIPVLSVDRASFRRASGNDPRLEVEIVMTLHFLDP